MAEVARQTRLEGSGQKRSGRSSGQKQPLRFEGRAEGAVWAGKDRLEVPAGGGLNGQEERWEVEQELLGILLKG